MGWGPRKGEKAMGIPFVRRRRYGGEPGTHCPFLAEREIQVNGKHKGVTSFSGRRAKSGGKGAGQLAASRGDIDPGGTGRPKDPDFSSGRKNSFEFLGGLGKMPKIEDPWRLEI